MDQIIHSMMPTRQSKGSNAKDLRTFFLRFIKLWSGSSIFLCAFIFVQTLAGNFGEKGYESWVWILINTIPVAILLIILYIKMKTTQPLGNLSELAKYIKLLCYLFLILLLCTILAEPLANILLHTTILNLYIKSYFLLIPLELLLIALTLLLYFKSKNH